MFESRKLKSAAFVFAILLASVFQVAAQESTFDDNALYELQERAREMLADKVLRITTMDARFEKGNKTPVTYEKYISETVPPDRNRFVVEKKTAKGIEQTEYIDIGRDRFVKRNGGEWEIFEPTGSGRGTGSGTGSGEEPKIETTSKNVLKKGEKINNQTVDLYQVVTNRKYIYPTKTYTDVQTESFWFDRNGRFVKTVEEYHDGETGKVSRKTVEYEYDPKIKIEAPVLKTTAKP